MSADFDPKETVRESISRIGEMHLEIERQFVEFENIIPFKYNVLIADCLYSPRLYNILQGISAAIDAMFKILIPQFEVSIERDNFPEYYKALNVKGLLSKQTVLVKSSLTRIEPFAIPQDKEVPVWWTAYNKTKHHLATGGARNATLGNTTQALGALVVLLHISKRLLNTKRYLPTGLLDGENWKDNSKEFQEAYAAVKFDPWLRWPLSARDEDEKYLVSKDYDFRSRVFYYTMQLMPPKSSLNDENAIGTGT